MRGRRPASPDLKLLKAERSDRLSAPPATAEVGMPDPPSHLSPDSLEEWHRLAAVLRSAGRLSPAFASLMAIYCVTYSRWLDALKSVEDRGMVIETDLGGVKPNPAITVADRCEKALARLLDALGLTPITMSRVPSSNSDAPQDALDHLLSRRRKA